MNARAASLSLADSLAAAVGLDRAPAAAAPAGSPAERWARSGLATLTGQPGAAPIFPERDYAGRLQALIDTVRAFAGLGGAGLDLDMGLFSARAREMGLARRGRTSANGTARLLPTADGWLAVNLARPEDAGSLPAWIGCDASDEPWTALAEAARSSSARALAEAGQGLGIPAAVVGGRNDGPWRARGMQPLNVQRMAPAPPPFMGEVARAQRSDGEGKWTVADLPSPSPHFVQGHLSHKWERRRKPAHRRSPLVIDLSSLWAGPLCGHILTQAGARVIKVESVRRPDGARLGPQTFYAGLHAGQEAVALDFAAPEGRAALHRLIARADVVIEGTRPRALEQLGVDLEAAFAANPALVWVSVTGYGRAGPWRNHVGFGDDAAAAGGLVAWDDDGAPVFVGDALADPVGGLMAAAGAFAALAAGGGFLVDVALREAAAYIADAPAIDLGERGRVVGTEGDWRLSLNGVETPLALPAQAACAAPAPAMGAHTAAVLSECA